MVERGRLSAAFVAELRSGNVDRRAVAPSETLEAELERACARAHAAFPEIDVPDETFVRHLARVVAEEEGSPPVVSVLAVEDLFLACACLVSAPGAAGTLRARHGTTIRVAIERTVRGADAGEIQQQLMDAMLVGSRETPPRPRIAGYGGRAPLDRWLQVSAQREALMWLRANQAETRARQGAAAEAPLVQPGRTHPETSYLKERYRGEFASALAQALERVGERDRVLLRLHLVNGLSVEKIGKMFGVSQPTASRWLATARQALLDDVKAELGKRLGSSSEELASLAGLVASRIDLSLSQLLRTR